jgi:hypothetical protein
MLALQPVKETFPLGYSTGVPAGRKINTVPAPANTVPVRVRVRYYPYRPAVWQLTRGVAFTRGYTYKK